LSLFKIVLLFIIAKRKPPLTEEAIDKATEEELVKEYKHKK